MTTEWPSFPEAGTKLFAITAKKDILDLLERSWTYARSQITAATAAQLIAARMSRFTPNGFKLVGRCVDRQHAALAGNAQQLRITIVEVSP